jgi:hypothetical protein
MARIGNSTSGRVARADRDWSAAVPSRSAHVTERDVAYRTPDLCVTRGLEQRHDANGDYVRCSDGADLLRLLESSRMSLLKVQSDRRHSPNRRLAPRGGRRISDYQPARRGDDSN